MDRQVAESNLQLQKSRSQERPYRLFLEEVFKGLAGVVRPGHPFRRGRGARGGRGRRGILFDRGAEFVERAVVDLVLACDPLGDRLHAFKARGGIKVGALLAAMQLEGAARALPFRIESRLEDGAAIGTARASDRSNHAWSPRSDLFLPRMAFVVLTFFFFLGLVGALVAPMLILPVQVNLRGDAQSYSESELANRKLSEFLKMNLGGRNSARAFVSSQWAHRRANPSGRKSGRNNFRGIPASERIASAAK